jgi:isopenicillin N synthase-like dioxygenase
MMNDEVKIISIEDHEDGSATLQIECAPEIFAAIFNVGFVALVKAGLESERIKDVRSSD